MKKLTYYIQKGPDDYEALYEYFIPTIKPDEIYARQLCTYFIKNGIQYELISNEMDQSDEMLVLKEVGNNTRSSDEKEYKIGYGIPIEFRKINNYDEHHFLTSLTVKDHWEAIRYLLKDYVELPGFGHLKTSSTEMDEDRSCYVIYVNEI